MKKLSVTETSPTSATRPTSLRPRSSSIRCSARSLGSPISSSASASSSACVAPRLRVPAMGRIVTLPSRSRTRISGTRSDDGKAREGEIVEEGRGVQAAQRAIERKGRQGEGPAEALARHHLEDVAGADIVLGALDDVEIIRHASYWTRWPRPSAGRRAGPGWPAGAVPDRRSASCTRSLARA